MFRFWVLIKRVQADDCPPKVNRNHYLTLPFVTRFGNLGVSVTHLFDRNVCYKDVLFKMNDMFTIAINMLIRRMPTIAM